MLDGCWGLVDGTHGIEAGLPLAPFLLRPPDVTHPDDVLLDAWLASLTPDQFAHVLDSLARPRMASSASAS